MSHHIVLSVPAAELGAFFPQPTRAALEGLGPVAVWDPGRLQDRVSLGTALADAEVLITGWGFPRLDRQVLALAPRLGFVMHSAASVRWLVGDAFWDAGIPISQAGAAMAPAVAELSLTLTLALLRRTHRVDHALRSGVDWHTARQIERARELAGAGIGVIGASRTGRAYIAACQALGADVRVYDPYLPPDDGLTRLGTGLGELLAGSEVIAIHAPATAETNGLIGAGELALIRDGGLFVNTARSAIVDQEALYAEAASGRIDVALDVFDTEPLQIADRWRSLPNVLLTPHLAGATTQSRARAGWIVVDEISRFLGGDALEHAVTRHDLTRMG
ncbi:hydroxyacid dehydrogenase [Kribbella sp. NPDC054772]